LPEKFFHSARKAAVLTANLQNYFARLTPPIISKKSRISDTRWNELRFLFKYNFFIFGCRLLPEKFTFYPKNNGFVRVRGAIAPLVRTPMVFSVFSLLRKTEEMFTPDVAVSSLSTLISNQTGWCTVVLLTYLKPVHTGDYSCRFRRQFVTENGECRRKVRLSPNSATVAVFSPFSATVALFCDSVLLAGLYSVYRV